MVRDAEYWLDRAQLLAARAVGAENVGDMEGVERIDDEYMRCLFNYYAANAEPERRSDKANQD